MSVKRVFAIIGIVLGAVTVFVGGVIGVMAAMGKFKTPVVKPEKIYFENAEQVIVAQYKDDLGKDVIYSFMLKGENNSIDYEVNVQDCFVWFDKGIGEDLIELCDENGNLLTADAKKRYTIKCNEKVYYKLKPVDETVAPDPTRDINGKVVLKARTADELHNAEEDLVVWIDRSIKNIFLNYGKLPTSTTERLPQIVNIGKDSAVEFDYVVNPEISMQPISKESKKIVELYYDDPKTEDFVLVNLENIKNKVAYSLYKIFDETKCLVDPITGELKLTFLSSEVTNGEAHYFKLAVFDSYNARAEFLADENNLTITNVKRLESMVVTDLYINVVNTSIDKVEMSSGELNLLLYTNDNPIYLNKEDADRNNLNVEMQSEGQVLDIRLDEVSLNAITAKRFNGLPKFVLESSVVGVVNEIDFADYDILSLNGLNLKLANKEDSSIVLNLEIETNIKVGDYLVVNTMRNENGYFYCINGIAMLYIGEDDSADKIKLLNVGSYLDFYILDEDTRTYTFATVTDIKYSFEEKEIDAKDLKEGNSKKYWNIVIEHIHPDILSGSKTLVLGLLVANNEGKFDAKNMFAAKAVSVNEQSLTYVVKKSSETLDLNVVGAEYVPDNGLDFDYFVDVTGGTYNACVLVVAEDEISKGVDPDKKDVSLVEYINAYIINNGKKYYVVGYFDDNGKFVNGIKTKDNPNITKESKNKLKLVQLINNFDESAAQMIDRLIKDKDLSEGYEIENTNVKALINETITVGQNLLVDSESVTFDVKVDGLTANPTGLYAGTSHIVEITSTNNDSVIPRLFSFYNITTDSIDSDANDGVYIVNNYPNNARIVEVSCNDNVLTLKINVGEILTTDSNVEIGLANVFGGGIVTKTLYSFKIEKSAPTSIVYYYDNGNKAIELTEDEENAPIVKAVITWDETNKVYNIEWAIEDDKLGNEFILNSSISLNKIGFQDPVFKVAHNITYEIIGSSLKLEPKDSDNKVLVVENNLSDSYLSVTIFGVTRYLKIKIVAEDFALTQTNTVIEGDSGNLSSVISYKYGANSIFSEVVGNDSLTLSNFSTQYMGTSLTLDTTTEGIFSFKHEDNEIFRIEKTKTETDPETWDWVFVRVKDKYAALRVEFDVITKSGKLSVSINFEQDVTRDFNAISWGVNPKLYAGTTIQLYEVAKGNAAFEKEALIKIRDKSSDNTIIVKNSEGVTLGETLPLSTGKYTFVVYVKNDGDETEIGRYEDIEVIPNVVVKQNTTEDLVLSSNSTNSEVFDEEEHSDPKDEIKGFVKLYQYQTVGVTYGSSVDDKGKIVLYSTESMLIDKTKDADNVTTSVTFESENNLVTKALDKTTVSTGWLDKVGEEKEVIVKVKKDGYEVGTFKVIVKNNYKITTTENINNKVLNIKAMENLVGVFNVDGLSGFNLESIQWKYSDSDSNEEFSVYSLSDGKLIIPAMNIRYDNITLVLTFKGDIGGETKSLIFEGKNIGGADDLTINVIPYELEDSANIGKAFSETSFDVLEHVYNTDDVEMNEYFEYIRVVSIKDKKDENGKSLTSSSLGYAYDSSNSTKGLDIEFDEILGDNISAFIEYEVKYIGGLIYNYKKEIILRNWQELNVITPEQSSELSYDKITLISKITGQEEEHSDVKVEPVLVNATNGASINLLNDESKFIKRLSATDRRTGNDSSVVIENIVVLAYQNSYGVSVYADAVSKEISVQNGVINFPKTSTMLSGEIAFRVFAESGNYVDYYFCVTSLGSSSTISGSTTGFINAEYKDEDGTKHVSSIVSGNIDKINIDKTFENKFGVVDLTKVKMFLLNATTLVSGAEFNKNVFGESVAQYSCVNDKVIIVNNDTKNIPEFTTVVLSLIYEDESNGYTYPIGILTLYLRPEGAVTSSVMHTMDERYSLSNDQGKEIGEFKAEIKANEENISLPSGFSYDATNQYGESLNNDIVEINSSIVLKNKVTDDYEFVVYFKYSSGYTIKVTYTYKAVDIKGGTRIAVGSLNKGSYDETLGKELSEFNNKFVINAGNYDDYFGDYQGEIVIGQFKDDSIIGGVKFKINDDYSIEFVAGNSSGEIMDGVKYSLSGAGELTLEFTQGLYNQEKLIGIEYSALNDNNKKLQVYTFDVARGLVVENEGGDNSGLNASHRLTTIKTGSYTTADGSYVQVTKTPTNDGVKYTIGENGYVIYVNNSNAELEFNVVSGSQYALRDSQIVDGTDKLKFVHHASNDEINVNLSFTISDGSNKFKLNANDIDTRSLYLTLSKTYLQIEAVYSTIPYDSGEKDSQGNPIVYAPTAENVVKGKVINSLGAYMFTQPAGVPVGLANQIRLRLKNLDGSYTESNFSGMGFVDPNNPNFITFEKAAGAKATITSNDDESQKIVFDSHLSVNEKCVLSLSNNAGMPNCSYTFQIMADTNVDGITLSDKDGYIGPGYMSFVVDYTFDEQKQKHETNKLLIGTIKDNENKGIWVQTTGDGENATDWKFLPKAGNLEERTANVGNYDIILEADPYNKTNYNIYMIYSAASITDTITVTPTIHGTSGYILNGFNLVLIKTTVKVKDENRDTSICGGDKIDLRDKIEIPADATVSINWEKSRYGASGSALSNVLSSSSGLVDAIVYESTAPMLQTRIVGQPVSIDLVLNVKIDGYHVKSITYRLQLNRGVQFFFNTGSAPSNWGTEEVYNYTTNFVMTNISGATKNTFGDTDKMNFSFNVDPDQQPIGGYYTSLNWLIVSKFKSAPASIEKNPNAYNPDVVNGEEIEDPIFKVANSGITFYKDYTGEINLLLKVTLVNGFNYSVNWKINVTGILTIAESIKTADGNLSKGSGYSSGTSVNLINDISGGSTGLYLSDKTEEFAGLIDYSDITVTVNQAIVQLNPSDGKTNKDRFAAATRVPVDLETEDVKDKKVQVTLPIVPSVASGSEVRYLVIYEVTLTYLGYTPKTSYYVAYKTVNFLNISVAEKELANKMYGANINVNERLNSDKKLDLFYYSETYTDASGNSYKIYLSGIDSSDTTNIVPKYKVFIDYKDEIATDITKDLTSIQYNDATKKLTITYDTGTTLNFSISDRVVENYYSVITDKNSTPTDEESDDTIEQLSVFSLSFNNITEFGEFIKSIDTSNSVVIDFEDEAKTDYSFKLEHIANGRWGINLAQHGTAFFSNKLEDASMIIKASNRESLYTLSKYNPETEKGLRLYTSTMLKAKGSKKISELFIPENVVGYATVKDYDIIGVYKTGKPSENWVTGTKSGGVGTPTNVSADIIIKVPKDDGSYIIYTLQQVQYSGADNAGVPGVCDVKQNFYVIKSDGDAAIYRADYNADVIQPFKEGENTVVDLSTLFKKFSNNSSGALVVENITPTGGSQILDGNNKENEFNLSASTSGGKLTVSYTKLEEIREANLGLRNVFARYTMEFSGGVELYCEFTFGLYPSNF